MSDHETQVGNAPLQFDRVIPATATSIPPERLAVVCEACQTAIETEYYNANGTTCCSHCRSTFESAAETPHGIGPFLKAGAFGLGAGIVGAVIYYAVIAITQLEIGIVAILIGYMVGRAVRKGARGQGGLRFQILAVALTYVSVALAYTPIAIQQIVASNRNDEQTMASTPGTASPVATSVDAEPSTPRSGGRFLLGIAMLLAFILALPPLVVFGSLPTSLIGGAIIGFGMQQAWRMTAAPRLEILGPYRVGHDPVSTSA